MRTIPSPRRRPGPLRRAPGPRPAAALGLLTAVLLAGCSGPSSPAAPLGLPLSPSAGAPSSAPGSPSASAAASSAPSAPPAGAPASSAAPTAPAPPSASTSRGAPASPSAPAALPPAAARPSAVAMRTATATPRRTPPPLTITDTATGTRVTLHVGQTLHVVLGAPDRAGSTYWQFGSLPTRLHSVGVSTVPGLRVGHCAPPGSGCGTVSLTAVAASAGTVTITAGRTSCGEALRCDAAHSSFRLTVVIEP
jgi:hypothetical protein